MTSPLHLWPCPLLCKCIHWLCVCVCVAAGLQHSSASCSNHPDLVFRTACCLHQLAVSGRQPCVKVPGLLRQLAVEWETDYPVVRGHIQNIKVEFEERLKLEAQSDTRGMLWSNTIIWCTYH